MDEPGFALQPEGHVLVEHGLGVVERFVARRVPIPQEMPQCGARCIGCVGKQNMVASQEGCMFAGEAIDILGLFRFGYRRVDCAAAQHIRGLVPEGTAGNSHRAFWRLRRLAGDRAPGLAIAGAVIVDADDISVRVQHDGEADLGGAEPRHRQPAFRRKPIVAGLERVRNGHRTTAESARSGTSITPSCILARKKRGAMPSE